MAFISAAQPQLDYIISLLDYQENYCSQQHKVHQLIQITINQTAIALLGPPVGAR